MTNQFSRRQFVQYSLMSAGGVVMSTGLLGLGGCSPEELLPAGFNHGVASGDPLSDRVIIWTRVTPDEAETESLRVLWEVALDENFENIVISDSAMASTERDFTIKADIFGLEAQTVYYYRFRTINNTSVVGKTKTLPIGSVDQVKLIALSCANFPAGYFHAYAEAARSGADAALHLGDYLYEYPRGGYASDDARRLDREVLPEGALISLSDYRTRYSQYRRDKSLQAFHAAMPMIAVWDDHEVANDTWREGAENHDSEKEGSFADRLMAALRAYSEWMPIRPPVDTDVASLYRSFQFGNLVNLSMLDTRLVGRDKQLSYLDYLSLRGFDFDRYNDDVNNTKRSLLGREQLQWLQGEMTRNTTWQVLGQQVLMGEMHLPGAVSTQQMSLQEYSQVAEKAALAEQDMSLLSTDELALLDSKKNLLKIPSLPYNLDAWDGYPAERAALLQSVKDNQAKLVVLAGDTHNAWANNIMMDGENVGVEFATSSVSSPGIENYLRLTNKFLVNSTERLLQRLVPGLQYTNLSDRGFLSITFTHDEVEANWVFVSSVKDTNYEVLGDRLKSVQVSSQNIKIA